MQCVCVCILGCNDTIPICVCRMYKCRMANRSHYHFRVLLIRTISTERLNHFAIHQLQLVDFFHAHGRIWTVLHIIIAAVKFRAELLRFISLRRGSGSAFVAFYCIRLIWKTENHINGVFSERLPNHVVSFREHYHESSQINLKYL